MLIRREWAMPNANTFTIRPIKEFVERHIDGCEVIVDPFANSCKYGTITNDLNPEFSTDFHMDAREFLKGLDSESADAVLYDPPYSITQAAQNYKSYGKERLERGVTNMGYWKDVKDEIARVTRVGGIVLSFGWNTNGIGKCRGFQIEEILIVAHGGSKNDTLCVRERKVTLEKGEIV